MTTESSLKGCREYEQECSACSLKAVHVSTEVMIHDGPGIKKAIIYRCPTHMDVPVEEMLRLTEEKLKSREHGK